ncbi:RING-type E3 ubiquitin transferase [Ranunculus cassubicifolius]
MGLPQTSSPPHLYPQALQLKLYQAFIFSVPILFSIILLLLFYLFYLKRRRDSSISSSPTTLARRSNLPSPLGPMPFGEGMKEEIIKENLPIVTFDDHLRDQDSQCCVCLGDFELREQLHQIPSCKHLFHIDCIHHWLKANYTCPLCRCYIYTTKKIVSGPPPVIVDIIQPSGVGSSDLSTSNQQLVGDIDRNDMNLSTGEILSRHEESTSGRTSLSMPPSNSQECTLVSVDGPSDFVLQDSVIIQVELHPS